MVLFTKLVMSHKIIKHINSNWIYYGPLVSFQEYGIAYTAIPMFWKSWPWSEKPQINNFVINPYNFN